MRRTFKWKFPIHLQKKTFKENEIDVEKEYSVSESVGEAKSKCSLIFPLPVEESDHDLLILYINQSLMTATYGMMELNGFSFGMKAPEGLQPKGFESVLNLIPV